MLTAEVILMNKYNNNNNKFKDILKKRGFYISLMAGAICVVAFTALYMNSTGKQGGTELRIDGSSEYADNGEGHSRVTEIGLEGESPTIPPLDKSNENISEKINVSEQATNAPQSTTVPKENENDEKKTDNTEKKIEKKSNAKSKNNNDAKVAVMESGKGVSNLKFDQEKGIMWPVKGEVIMKYSPDSVIYHKSLGAYKTNPAVIIAAEKGANVCSGTDAVVTDIGENEEVGKYVITSIGDDYKIVYGQLDNIQVKQGASLKEGEIIGTIAAPTKYYIEEGCNLYLKMICDDQTVDPLIFLR